jgi:hypothetical protein
VHLGPVHLLRDGARRLVRVPARGEPSVTIIRTPDPDDAPVTTVWRHLRWSVLALAACICLALLERECPPQPEFEHGVHAPVDP